jgi:hypothetical protein
MMCCSASSFFFFCSFLFRSAISNLHSYDATHTHTHKRRRGAHHLSHNPPFFSTPRSTHTRTRRSSHHHRPHEPTTGQPIGIWGVAGSSLQRADKRHPQQQVKGGGASSGISKAPFFSHFSLTTLRCCPCSRAGCSPRLPRCAAWASPPPRPTVRFGAVLESLKKPTRYTHLSLLLPLLLLKNGEWKKEGRDTPTARLHTQLTHTHTHTHNPPPTHTQPRH